MTLLEGLCPCICTRVSNGTGQRNFSGQRDRQNFIVPGQRDNGIEVPLLSRDKGTTGQAQNLAKGRDGPGQPKSGTGRGTKRDRAEKDVLKQENDILKQKMMFYNRKGYSRVQNRRRAGNNHRAWKICQKE